jgi:hypothetical protein
MQRHKPKSSNPTNRRPTMADIIAQSRATASRSAWRRARTASSLRHEAVRQGRASSAARLAVVKHRAVQAAVAGAPRGRFALRLDVDYQIGMLSVRCVDGTRLHVPSTLSVSTLDRCA